MRECAARQMERAAIQLVEGTSGWPVTKPPRESIPMALMPGKLASAAMTQGSHTATRRRGGRGVSSSRGTTVGGIGSGRPNRSLDETIARDIADRFLATVESTRSANSESGYEENKPHTTCRSSRGSYLCLRSHRPTVPIWRHRPTVPIILSEGARRGTDLVLQSIAGPCATARHYVRVRNFAHRGVPILRAIPARL